MKTMRPTKIAYSVGLAGHVPRNIEGECAVNVAGHVTHGVTVVARLRHDGGTPLSRRGNVALQRNPTTPKSNVRILLSATGSRAGAVARDILIRVRAPGVTPMSQCDRVVFDQAEGESNERLFVLPLVLFLAGASNVACRTFATTSRRKPISRPSRRIEWVPIKVPSLSAISSTDRSRAPSTSNLPPKA